MSRLRPIHRYFAQPPTLATVASAALLVAAFPPWNLSFLIWVALFPWLWQLTRSSLSTKQAFVQGLWLSVLMSIGGFYWVARVLNEFAGAPWPVAILGLLLFSLIGQPQFPIFAMIYRYFRNPSLRPHGVPWQRILFAFALGATYAGVDWILPKLFVDTLGHSLYASRLLRQCADLGGAPLLTFLIFLINDACIELCLRLKTRNEPSYWPSIAASTPQLGTAVLLLFAGSLYGHFRLQWVNRQIAQSNHFAHAAAIQGNIGDFDKIASERGLRSAGEKVLSTYFELSDQALSLSPRPDFLIWPETAYPSTFRNPSTATELGRDQQVEAYVHERGIPLLFGGYDRARGHDFNALFNLAPKPDQGITLGSDLQIYRKNILLLFGEFIPGAEYFKPLKDAFPQVGNFGRGVGPEVLQVTAAGAPGKILKFGPIICYEALFPNYVIGAARLGSHLILNITNDSWFGPYGEPELHLALVAFRSLETRLPQLRVTNTGISSLILPTGEITQKTPINEKAILQAQIPIYPEIWTLMKAWGDWFGITALILGGLGSCLRFRQSDQLKVL